MVFVILVNWNGWFDTIQCLESIFRSTYRDFKVIVVDNDSQDSSIDIISAWAENRVCIMRTSTSSAASLSFPPLGASIPCAIVSSSDIDVAATSDDCDLVRNSIAQAIEDHPLILVRGANNVGFGRGNNIGIKIIEFTKNCDYVFFLNNDTVIEPDALGKLVEYSLSHPRTVVGAILRLYSSPEKIQAVGGGLFSQLTGRVSTLQSLTGEALDFVNGASFFVTKEFIDETGGFDENIFMYFEENEYCIRAKKRGFRFECSNAVVYHKGGGSSGGRSEKAWTYVWTNKYYVMRKHFGLGIWVIFFFSALVYNSSWLNRNLEKRRAARSIIRRLILGSQDRCR